MWKRMPYVLLLSLQGTAAAFLLSLLPTLASAQSIPTTLGWYQIPNTKLRSVCPNPSTYPQIQGIEGCSAIVEDWSGGAFDSARNRLLILGGGHGGYAGNEVYALDLDTLTMERLNEPSTVVRDGCTNNGTYADGKPVARHTYNHLEYLPNQDSVFLWGGGQWQSGCAGQGDTWLFNLTNLSWTLEIANTNPTGPSANFGRGAAYDPNTGLVYLRDDFDLYSYNPVTNAWIKRSSSSFGMNDYKTGVIDPVRKKYFLHGDVSGTNPTLYWYDISSPTATVPIQSGQTSGCAGFIGNYKAGIAYDPAQNRIVGWNGGNTIYILNPDTLSCTTVSYSGGPTTSVANGTFGRFRYSPSLNVFVVCNSVDADCYALRLTSGTTPPPPPPPPPPTGSVSASPSSISFSATVGGSVPVAQSITVTVPSGGAWSANDNSPFYDESVSCWSGAGNSCPSGASTTLSPNSSFFQTATAGTYSSPLTVSSVGYSNFVVPVTLTITQGTTPPPPPPPSTNADVDFQTRCSASGVLVCKGFDSASDFVPAIWPNPGLYPAGDGAFRGTLDSTVKASGGGSLRFEIPGGTGANSAGQWRQAFGQAFGPGQTFYVQFRQRFSPEMFTADFGGGGWKQVIFHDARA